MEKLNEEPLKRTEGNIGDNFKYLGLLFTVFLENLLL